MDRIAYSVAATFPDRRTLDEYVAWLEDGHIEQVLAHGAGSGVIVRLEPGPGEPPHQAEARYIFPSRECFDRYVERYAPGLRAEGLKRFPAERGIRFERRVGTVL